MSGEAFLIIKVKNQGGDEVIFRMKRNMQLQKLMDQYCDRNSVPPNAYRFLFDGRQISPKDTPDKLGLENEDVIDAMLPQTGGSAIFFTERMLSG